MYLRLEEILNSIPAQDFPIDWMYYLQTVIAFFGLGLNLRRRAAEVGWKNKHIVNQRRDPLENFEKKIY